MEEHGQFCDVCIVCAMYEEAQAVLDEFSMRCNVSFTKAFSRRDRYEYRRTTIRNIHNEPLTMLVTWPSDRGPVQTGLDLKPFLDEFRPRFAAMTGICAGDRKKVKLGDLIVAECAYLYEAGKIITEPDGQTRQLIEMQTVASTSQVLQYVRGFEEWKAPLREMKQARLKRTLKANEEPRCVVAPMASGMAVRSDNPFPWLREKYHRNTVGLDMEAASFYRAFGALSHIHALVVKGVSDYGDGSKNDRFHDYAARASAVYLLTFIQEYVTEETMPRRDMLPPTDRAGPSGVWNVPFGRNPHFTGRDDLLDQLRQHLSPEVQDDQTTTRRAALTQPQAIKGLGGIGKTQIAVEYAYRFRDLYTHTLWVNAASGEALITSFVALAELLPSFSAKSERDQGKLVAAIKRWLEQCEQEWLLIFDNADNISLVRQYLPQRGKGSILLTTRAHAVGSLAASIEVEKMGLMEGTQFLLRRAQRFDHALDEEVNKAGNVVIALDHFPLALDQAGAYIEETGCGFSDYLQIYQDHRRELLAKRGLQATDYPDSVATTWSLSFHRVEQANPAAAALLRLCAFLAPDAIPEELLSKGASDWSLPLQQAAADAFALDQAIAELLRYSLIKRHDKSSTLSIHRLVQVVLRDTLSSEQQRRWAECVVRAVNSIFPEGNDAEKWPLCLRYLSQAQMCYELVEQYALQFTAAIYLLSKTAAYLMMHRALYEIAEPLCLRALQMSLLVWDHDHSDTAACLSNLAFLYQKQGKYVEAQSLQEQALDVQRRVSGDKHDKTARILHNLGKLYQKQGKYEEAEALYQQALEIKKQELGAEHPQVAVTLNDLAVLYHEMGKYEEVEELYRQALRIDQQALGIGHPDTLISLSSLAAFYWKQGKYEKAEESYREALEGMKRALGSEHPVTANCLHNLGALYYEQRKYEKAEESYREALEGMKRALGNNHPDVASVLNNLALLCKAQKKYKEAEHLHEQALAIRQQVLGTEHPDTATSLNDLAWHHQRRGQYKEAEALYLQALLIRQKVLGAEHPDTATSLNGLAVLYSTQERYTEAEALHQQTLQNLQRVLGTKHPGTATCMSNLAALYQKQRKYAEAESLYLQALQIRQQVLGAEHPDTATSLRNLAALYRLQGRHDQAEQLLCDHAS